MKNILILISGMPGTGKTTFSDYLAAQLSMPLLSQDKILTKVWDITHSPSGNLASDFFWFFCETIMKSHCSLIAEHIFSNHPREQTKINTLVSKYGYKTINIHFDADFEIAYKRVIERNKNPERHECIIINPDFETFSTAFQAYKDFSFGENRIIVNTSDFSKVSYGNIKSHIETLTDELTKN